MPNDTLPPGAPPSFAPSTGPGAPGNEDLNPTETLITQGDAAQQDLAQGRQAVGRISKQENAVIDDTRAQGEAAIDSQSRLEQDKAEASQPTLKNALEGMQSISNAFEADSKMAKEHLEQARNSYMGAVDNASKLRVYDWWANKSTGAKILGVISQVLAGGVQGLTGQLGADTPLDRIIKQDIQLQIHNAELTQQDAQNKKSLYAELKDQIKDQGQAYAAAMEAAYKTTMQRLDIIAKQMGTQEALTNAEKAKAELGEKVAQFSLKALDSQRTSATQYAMANGQSRAAWTGMALGFQESQSKLRQAAAVAAQNANALQPQIQTKMVEKTSEGKMAIDGIDALMDGIKNGSNWTDVQSQTANLAMTLGKFKEAGALSGGDLALIETILGRSTGYAGGMSSRKETELRVLKNVRDSIVNSVSAYQETARTHGKKGYTGEPVE